MFKDKSRKFHFLIWGICIFFWNCQINEKAQAIVARSIAAHGGDAYESLEMEFDFRDKHYRLSRDHGNFQYERGFKDSLDREILDRLTNNGLERWIDGGKQELSEEQANSYRNSVNSVMYFMLLPYGLNDEAVKKKWLGERKVKGKKYDLVRVTFGQNGGGDDHHDIYLYWFNQEDGMLDYLAYRFFSDGGGMRFREAINRRKLEGVIVQDYKNYKANPDKVKLKQLDRLFEEEKLELLSKIINNNVQITVKQS